jgi:integrase
VSAASPCSRARSSAASAIPSIPFKVREYIDRELVFADALGGAVHPQRLTEWFGEHRRAAGIPTGSLHTLRHTAATLALTAGVPVHIVAVRLGDDAKTILSTYAHLLPQSDEMAAERVAAALAGIA